MQIASSQFHFLEFPFFETLIQGGISKFPFIEKVQITDAELRGQEIQVASHSNHHE